MNLIEEQLINTKNVKRFHPNGNECRWICFFVRFINFDLDVMGLKVINCNQELNILSEYRTLNN